MPLRMWFGKSGSKLFFANATHVDEFVLVFDIILSVLNLDKSVTSINSYSIINGFQNKWKIVRAPSGKGPMR